MSNKQLKDFDMSYLQPPKEANNIQHSENYIHHVKENNYHVRKIFYNVDYSDYENEKIDEFEAELKKRNIPLPEEWDKAKSLKYCLTGQMIVDDSIKAFQTHVSWLNDENHQLISPETEKLLEKGLIYQSGRDREFRPVVYMQVKYFDQKKNVEEQLQAISNLLLRVRRHMYLKGKIENTVVILDLTDVSMWSMPVDLLKRIASTITINFTCSLHRMYLLNPPTVLRMGFNMVRKFMVEETAKKLQMLATDEYSQLQELIEKDQLQIKYGGTLPNIDQFWPPKNTYTQQKKSQKVIRSESQIGGTNDELQNQQTLKKQQSIQYGQESEYFSLANNSLEFFGEDYQATMAQSPNLQELGFKPNEIDINPGQDRPSCCQCSIF